MIQYCRADYITKYIFYTIFENSNSIANIGCLCWYPAKNVFEDMSVEKAIHLLLLKALFSKYKV